MLLAPVALAWTAFAFALPVAISSSLNLVAESNAGNGVVTNTGTQSQGATVNPLNAAAHATSVFVTATVDTQASAAATWTDTASGNVTFRDVGWETSNVSSGSANLVSGTNWQYKFTADATGLFTMKWNIFDSGGSTDTFGLNGFTFDWDGAGGGDVFNFPSSGSDTRAIVAGITYTVGLENAANISGSLGNRVADMDGLFNWSMDTAVTAVPEPATLALLGVGLAGLGFSRRK